MAGMPPPADSGAGRGRGMTLPSWMTGQNTPGSGPPPTSTMQFRPSAPGQPSQQQYMHPGASQQFRTGAGPPPPPMGTQFPPQMTRPNQPPTPQSFNQYQRPGMMPPSSGVPPAFQQVQSMQINTQPWHGVSSQPSSSGPQSSTVSVTPSPPPSSADWQEHSAPDGRRYYYNKKTKVSSWEKPMELMTPVERADASTVWKEFTTADGRKYYYNKLTKQSKWTMPDEMKLARERAESTTSPAPAQAADAPNTSMSSVASPLPSLAAVSSPASTTATGLPPAISTNSPVVTSAAVASASAADAMTNSSLEPKVETEKTLPPKDEVLDQDIEEAKKTMPSVGAVNVSVAEDKSTSTVEEQPVYSNKTEAKNAFKELLEAVHVQADWTWEQAMRVIINDKRYGALKTLGERKQAFNEYLAQRKKQGNEEKRLKQKKAREEFVIMLQESKELTSTMRWGKAAALFAEDPRYQAVDKERDRVELFDDYLHDLEKKERDKAREDRKKNLLEYRTFLESCDFIKVTTQWRKAIDKLEDDERCSRLEKMDRLEIFQDYIRYLEKVEDEEKREHKEQQRRRERKNRDEFRKLLADDRASGILTARVGWTEYVAKIREHPAYEAICTNLSGSTPKDLFEDFTEDIEKKYQEDKAKVKEMIKAAKINVTTTWTFDKFKEAIAEAGDLSAIDESNLKIVYDDVLDRAKEKEEKEAKKKKRLVDDFIELLHHEKSITNTSKWEECEALLESAPEFRALSDDSVRQEAFEDYVALLQQKAKEKEKKREEEKAKKEKDKEKEKEREKEREKRKDKERKEKDKDKEKEKEKDKDKDKERERERLIRKDRDAHPDTSDRENTRLGRKDADADEKEREKISRKERDFDIGDVGGNHVQKEERKKEKDKDRDREREKERKHRKSHRSRSSDDGSSGREDRDEVKRPRKHSDKRKSSRKHAYESNSDSENRHKRHRKDRDAYRRNGAADELEDGELGEDGEIQ